MVPLNISLPDGFLEEEMRDGYLVTSEAKALWAVLLDLYSEFARVCDELGLRFFASSGTALGAVRHKGFIPWDNDIDLMMMRDQYDVLCANADKFDQPYFFQTHDTDVEYYISHAQLRRSDTTAVLADTLDYRRKYNQGVFIDIFPLDEIPDDEVEAKAQGERIEELKTAIVHTSERVNGLVDVGRSPKRRIVHALRLARDKKGGADKLYAEMVAEQTRYKGANAKRLSNLTCTPANPRVRRYREDLEEALMMDFEFLQMPVPAGYDHALTCIYGDYMKPVSGGDMHGSVHVDLDRPYGEWLDEYFNGREV